MKNKNPNNVSENFDWQDVLHYMKLSPREKLEYLQKMNEFFHKATPVESKKNWERLKALGF